MPTETNQPELFPFVCEVIVAQVSNKKVASSDIAPPIRTVYEVFHELVVAGTPAAKPVPAVPIKSSVTPDYIVMSRGRQTAQDAEASSPTILQHDTRSVPAALGSSCKLPHGRTELCQEA